MIGRESNGVFWIHDFLSDNRGTVPSTVATLVPYEVHGYPRLRRTVVAQHVYHTDTNESKNGINMRRTAREKREEVGKEKREISLKIH